MLALQQPRAARACSECNRKKTKCDMERPICGLCRRTGTRCEFPTKRRAAAIRKAQGRSTSQKINENLGRLLRLLDADSEHAQELPPRQGSSLRSYDHDSPPQSPLILQNQSDTERQAEPECAYQQDDLARGPETGTLHIQAEQTQRCSPVLLEESILQSPTESSFHQLDLPQAEGGRQTKTSVKDEVSYDLAIHLVHIFFDRIQCWLPLLHKPSFLARYRQRLNNGHDSTANLPVEEKLLLFCLFALAARYSESAEFADIPPLSRGNRFNEVARELYDKARDLQSASIPYLQGCILLSFWYYTSGFSTRGWIVVGVCVRLAYELDLSNIDDDDDNDDDDQNSDSESQTPASLTVIEKEEKRRAWWLIWELDTFGSSVSKRPFAIDRRRMAVRLPVSDETWFSGTPDKSSLMDTRPGESWKSLRENENHDARAWFLVANHLMASVHEHMQRRRGIDEDVKLILENEISCFKLSLPPKMQLSAAQIRTAGGYSVQSNWIIGMHLMLSATSFMLSSPLFTSKTTRNASSYQRDVSGVSRARISDISYIATVWPAALIETSHPFFACLLLPVHNGSNMDSVDPAISSSNRDVVRLILTTYARSWELGSRILRLAELLQSPHSPVCLQDKEYVGRYAAFFPSSKKVATKPLTTENRDSSYSASSRIEWSQDAGKSPESGRPVCDRTPESSAMPDQQHLAMLNNATFDMNSLDFDRVIEMETQGLNFPFSGIFEADDCHSYLPLDQGPT